MLTADSTHLTFNDILPQLAGLYRQGLLVPFVGAGMSNGVCCGWHQLLRNLGNDRGFGWASTIGEATNKTTLIRYADEIVSALRPETVSKQINVYRSALQSLPKTRSAPQQSVALKKLYWPLIISTNYDDVILNATEKYRPTVVGRSLEDCHTVLHSLNELSGPLLWTIQGFVGGQLKDLTLDQKLIELAGQIVLGHQQYQSAINAAPHFRRAFAEVYRRRSLLFLGSGVTEDYLANLFGEILHNQGCGPYPHFALIKKDKQKDYDSLFMQQRFGIIPIFYNEHSDLPEYLNKLAGLIKYWLPDEKQLAATAPKYVFQDEIGFKLAVNSDDGVVPVKLRICKGGWPDKCIRDKQCAIVSVGRFDNHPIIGSQANGLFKKIMMSAEGSENSYIDDTVADIDRKIMMATAAQNWTSLDNAPSYVFRHKKYAVFALAARSKEAAINHHDIRDLGIVAESVCSALRKIDESDQEFDTVHIGAIASGKGRYWDPIHPFAQTLVGIKKWASEKKRKHIRSINMYIVDPAPWASIVTRKIQLETLLSSDISSHVVETIDTSGTRESFTITLKESPTLEELLNLCKLNRSQWNVTLFPNPTELGDSIPNEMRITSTMRVILTALKLNPSKINGLQ